MNLYSGIHITIHMHSILIKVCVCVCPDLSPLEKRRQKQKRAQSTKQAHLWLDMLYDDFAHHRPLLTLDFSGYKLTDDMLRKTLQAPGVSTSLRCVLYILQWKGTIMQ